MSDADDMALLVLDDGSMFPGRAWGARGRVLGEAIFSTAMTGYEETLTDPSYHGQIVVMTAPHIGNTGMNDEDEESKRIWVAGFVVREPSRISSSWRARRGLEDDLVDQGVVGISGVDTRAITRHIRTHGAMRAGIFSGDALPAGAAGLTDQARDALVAIVHAQPPMSGAELASDVTTDHGYVVAPPEGVAVRGRVVAVDLGVKAHSPQMLAARGLEVHVLPQSVGFADVEALHPDGVFFSNGPGDPASATHEVDLLRAVLDAKIPFFGICFGHQLLGRALGYGTYKLQYGHHGINRPVLERATGHALITSQNHGFAVDAPVDHASVAPFDHGRYGRVEVSHVDLNDGVVEGLRALDLPAFSVQFHPEAAAGPHDGAGLFDRFVDMVLARKEVR